MSTTKPDDEYEESTDLVRLVKSILDCSVPELHDAKRAKFDIVFSRKADREGSGTHKGGVCKRVEGSVRYKTKLDFMITIFANQFLPLSQRDKVKLVVHELHHIHFNYKGKPSIRAHSEEYCEILSHDKLSDGITERIWNMIQVPQFPNGGGKNYEERDGVRIYRK